MKILHTEWMGVKGGQGIRVIEDLKMIIELGFTPFWHVNLMNGYIMKQNIKKVYENICK